MLTGCFGMQSTCLQVTWKYSLTSRNYLRTGANTGSQESKDERGREVYASHATCRTSCHSTWYRRSACRVACVYLSTSLILALLAPCVCACSQVVPRSQRVFPSHLQTCALHAETAGQHWVQSLPVRLYARADSLSSHPRHPPSVSNYQMMALADQFQSGTLPRAANQSVLLAPIGLTSGFLGRLAVAAEIFQM